MDGDDHEPDGVEHAVAEEALEDVLLVVDLSGSDHVCDLHEHEDCEDDGVVTRHANVGSVLQPQGLPTESELSSRVNHAVEIRFIARLFRNKVFSSKDDSEDDNRMEDSHVEDVLNHLSRDDVLISSLRRSL